jgi:protein SCO1/2
MFYGSCSHTCPLLIETLRAVERAAPRADALRVLMISIDPARDTPAVLEKISRERRIDLSRWTLVTTDAATVRKIAAVLNIQYKQSPDGEFNHSSVITLLTPQGEIAVQSAKLGKADESLGAALREVGKAVR